MASVQEAPKKIQFDGRNLASYIDNGPYFAQEVIKVYEDIKSDNLRAREILETFEEIKSHTLIFRDTEGGRSYIPVEQAIKVDVTYVVSLKEYILKALGKLKGHKGMPPLSDPGVMNIISNLSNLDDEIVFEEKFFVQFKEVAKRLARYLQRYPVQCHEETVNGAMIADFLKNKKKSDNTMDICVKTLATDTQGRVSMLFFENRLSKLALFIMSQKPVPLEEEFQRALDNVKDEVDVSMVSADQFRRKLNENLRRLAIELNKRPALASKDESGVDCTLEGF